MKRTILMLGLSLLLAAIFITSCVVTIRGAGLLSRVTEATNIGRNSLYPGINTDGTRIVFQSNSDFLSEGITTTEIWLYDTATMNFTRITTASAGDRFSILPDISGDGNRVVFISNSDFFDQGTTGQNIWLYDLTTKTLTQVTAITSFYVQDYLAISGDGNTVAFDSDFDFLGQGVNTYEIWLYDTAAMTVTRITTTTEPNRASRDLRLNEDGTRVVFTSNGDFLRQGVLETQREIWLYDTNTMTFTRVTSAPNGIGNSFSDISADGSTIAFAGDADFLGQGVNTYEIWLYDTTTMTLTRVTTATDNNRQSAYPRLNADGTRVVFVSDVDFLGQNIPNDQYEVWLYDTHTMTYTRITSDSSGNPDNFWPVINGSGTRLAFSSDRDYSTQYDQFEIWLYHLSPQQLYLPLVWK